jgi:uncharacterized damage-inducible protein DinB
MTIADALIREMEHEAVATRKVLERVPDSNFGYKPHDKSFTFGQLASHLADIPTWVRPTMELDEFAFSMEGFKPFDAKTSKELLDHFNTAFADAMAALKGASDERLQATWSMTMDGHKIVEGPRVTVLRSFIINHSIHHRGQLTVYLRMNNIPLPAVYGPSADEQ